VGIASLERLVSLGISIKDSSLALLAIDSLKTISDIIAGQHDTLGLGIRMSEVLSIIKEDTTAAIACLSQLREKYRDSRDLAWFYFCLSGDTTIFSDSSQLEKTSSEVIHSSADSFSIQSFPNPANKDNYLVVTPFCDRPFTIDLFDFQGRMVKRLFHGDLAPIPLLLRVDVSQLPPSMYYYMIHDGISSTMYPFLVTR
jgi:hypothetical protein